MVFMLIMLLLEGLPCSVAFNNGAANSRLPPLGWSSWVALGNGSEHPVFDYCEEESVKRAADAFVTVGLAEAGYRHFHLDDCWAGSRDAVSGKILPDVERFPNGMKVVVDYVHNLNLSFGLYTCAGTRLAWGDGQEVLAFGAKTRNPMHHGGWIG